MKLQLAFLPVMASIALFSCSKPVQDKGKSPFDVLEETYKGPVPGQTVVNKSSFHREKITQDTSSQEVRRDENKIKDLLPKNTISAEKAMDSLYDAMDKKPQVFTINASSDSKVTCKEGTVIEVPAFAFLDRYRRPVYGTVSLEVKEYYELEDMLFASLNSMSDGNLLESSGMICVKARQDNMELRLAGGKEIDIKMPAKYLDKGMQLFYGNGNDRKLNWKKAKNRNSQTRKVKTFQYTIDKTISYKRNDNHLVRLENSTPYKPDIDDKMELQDTVVISFVMDARGRTKDHTLLLNRQLIDSAAPVYNVGYYKEDVKLHSKCFIDEDDKLRSNKEHHINYKLIGKTKFHGLPVSGYSVRLSSANIKELKKIFKRGDSTMTITITEVYIRTNDRIREKAKQEREAKRDLVVPQTYYTYEVNNLGWINSDRFYYVERDDKTNYRITGNTSSTDDVKIIFTGMKSIMQGLNTGSTTEFSNIPANMNIVVVGVRYNRASSGYEFAMAKTSTSDTNTKLQYVPVNSIEEIKKKLAEAIN